MIEGFLEKIDLNEFLVTPPAPLSLLEYQEIP